LNEKTDDQQYLKKKWNHDLLEDFLFNGPAHTHQKSTSGNIKSSKALTAVCSM
jgi:hypothetical protein